MNKNLDIINFAALLIIKVAFIAIWFSGKSRKCSLRRLSTMDINEKDKEILFLRDIVNQLKNAGINPSKRDEEETEEPSIYPSQVT